MTAVHTTTSLMSPDGEVVDIDVELTELIQQIWHAGVTTVSCCQDVGETIRADLWPHLAPLAAQESGRAVIGFLTVEDAAAFMDRVANAGPRDAFYVRMVHWAAPDAWAASAALTDLSIDDDGSEPTWSEFATLGASVKFPRSDLPEIRARLRRANRGELHPPGPVDWSSVEVDTDEDPDA